MTVDELIAATGFAATVLSDGGQAVTGGFVGDRPSEAIAKAREGYALITSLPNTAMAAAAYGTMASCLILTDGVTPGEDLVQAACGHEINLLQSPAGAFATAVLVGRVLEKGTGAT